MLVLDTNLPYNVIDEVTTPALTCFTGAPDDKGVSIHIWIDNYCRDKPLSALPQAVEALTR
jgi:hypothetical protein